MDELEPIRAAFRQAGLYHHAADDLLCQRLADAMAAKPAARGGDAATDAASVAELKPRTLKLNAHRSLVYYTPEDVADLEYQLKTCADALTMVRIQRDAAVEKVRALRSKIRDVWLLAGEEDSDALS